MSVEFPKSLGECIDKMYALRTERLNAQKLVDAMKAEEGLYEEHILATFTKVSLNGAKGNVATAGVKHSTVYDITDWGAFLADVKKKKAWDCLQKRLSTAAVAARFDNNKALAGIEIFQKISITLNKVGAK